MRTKDLRIACATVQNDALSRATRPRLRLSLSRSDSDSYATRVYNWYRDNNGEYIDLIPLVCDEYPFWSTKEGATSNETSNEREVNAGKISIRYVPETEQIKKPGTQGQMMRGFPRKCKVAKTENKYHVKMIANKNRSTYGVMWKEFKAKNGNKKVKKIHCLGSNAR